MVRVLQKRHGLISPGDRRNEDRVEKDKGAEGGRQQEVASGSEQVGFRW
jgi:hypothetical protein